jgi:hypothetical protein
VKAFAKPGDHPDFFRMLPPPGASRDSTIVLNAEGHFFHDGERVEHVALERAMRTWITRHPDDGRPILSNGYDWCYFKVEGTPLFVDAVRIEGDPPTRATLVLFDGTEEPLDPKRLFLDADGVVCARARLDLIARFTRHAQTDLAPLLAGDGLDLVLDGVTTRLENA